MAPMLLDGDMVLVQHTSVADNGDIVVATVDDGESTVKRLRRVAGNIFSNPSTRPTPSCAETSRWWARSPASFGRF